MKILIKTIKSIAVGIFIIFILYLIVGIPEGYYVLNPYIDTEMAPDCRPENFNKIIIGMGKTEVINILGNPLRKEKVGWTEEYYYTNDGYLLTARKSIILLWRDFAWYRLVIRFDLEEKVIHINKGWTYD